MTEDLYQILGVSKTATTDEIKKAYRKLAHQYHPDKNQGNKEYEEKFKKINNAYETLGDEQKRANYDRFGSAGSNFGQGTSGFSGFNQGGVSYEFNMGGADGFSDLNDVFESFFGGASPFGSVGSSSRRQSAGTQSRSRGVDIETEIELTLSEVAIGVEKIFDLKHNTTCKVCLGKGFEPGTKVNTCPTCSGSGKVYQRMQTIFGVIQQETVCPTCSGRGKIFEQNCHSCKGKGFKEEVEKIKVDIPVGVDDGDLIKVSGKGHAGYQGSSPGDLFLRVKIKPEKGLRRDNMDTFSIVKIDYFDLLLGAKISVPTVWGETLIEIEPLTNPKDKLKIKNKGMPKLNNPSIRGDHYIDLQVQMPSKLNKEQSEVLQNLKKTLK
jgi:molecular chaperone DnaJ